MDDSIIAAAGVVAIQALTWLRQADRSGTFSKTEPVVLVTDNPAVARKVETRDLRGSHRDIWEVLEQAALAFRGSERFSVRAARRREVRAELFGGRHYGEELWTALPLGPRRIEG